MVRLDGAIQSRTIEHSQAENTVRLTDGWIVIAKPLIARRIPEFVPQRVARIRAESGSDLFDRCPGLQRRNAKADTDENRSCRAPPWDR